MPRGPSASRLVITATPVAQCDIRLRSRCASSGALMIRSSHTPVCETRVVSQLTFDAIVLGAGPAGEVAAGRLGEGGLRVAIVEQHLVGGECSYYACMPSKALIRPGELLAEARRVPGVPTNGLDVGAVLARRDEVIHDLDDSGHLLVVSRWVSREHADEALRHYADHPNARAANILVAEPRRRILATGAAG